MSIDLELSDAAVDIVSEGFDLAIRISPLKYSGLIARKIADNPKLVYAAPSYLAIWAVYPTRKQVLPKLRAFVEKLQQSLI